MQATNVNKVHTLSFYQRKGLNRRISAVGNTASLGQPTKAYPLYLVQGKPGASL